MERDRRGGCQSRGWRYLSPSTPHMHSSMRRLLSVSLVCLVLSSRAGAQQAADVHVGYTTTTQTHTVSYGIGGAIESIVDLVPLIDVALTVGADYQRVRGLGPGRGSVSLDATIQPERETTGFVPYLGAGVSANWSGGQQSEWAGSKPGLDAIAGLKFSFLASETVAARIEQRFGYVQGVEHHSTTRLGLIFAL